MQKVARQKLRIAMQWFQSRLAILYGCLLSIWGTIQSLVASFKGCYFSVRKRLIVVFKKFLQFLKRKEISLTVGIVGSLALAITSVWQFEDFQSHNRAQLTAFGSSLFSLFMVLQICFQRFSGRINLASIVIHASCVVVTHAAIYHGHKLIGGCTTVVNGTPLGYCDVMSWDKALYFSIVTWTTLGYGDFQPRPELWLVAASEAVVGYIFLGLIVGVLAGEIAKENP